MLVELPSNIFSYLATLTKSSSHPNTSVHMIIQLLPSFFFNLFCVGLKDHFLGYLEALYFKKID